MKIVERSDVAIDELDTRPDDASHAPNMNMSASLCLPPTSTTALTALVLVHRHESTEELTVACYDTLTSHL